MALSLVSQPVSHSLPWGMLQPIAMGAVRHGCAEICYDRGYNVSVQAIQGCASPGKLVVRLKGQGKGKGTGSAQRLYSGEQQQRQT